MTVGELGKILIENWVISLSILVTIVSTVWGIASLYYRGRLATLRANIDLLRDQKTIAEKAMQRMEARSVKISEGTENQSLAIGAPSYPAIKNPEKLSRKDISRLAEYYDLTELRGTNPNLVMKEGDISYWYEQGLTEEQLRLEFNSRRLVLEHAEKKGKPIGTQGDLSSLAQEVQSMLLRDI